MEDRNKDKRKRHTKEYYLRVKAEFVDFLADPEEERLQGVFAKDKDVSGQTLSDWKGEDGFWDKVWERFTGFYLQGQLPAVNRKLVQKAKRGDKDAMDRVYKLAGRMPPDKFEHELPQLEGISKELKDTIAEVYELKLRRKSVPYSKGDPKGKAPNMGGRELPDGEGRQA